MKAGGPGMVPFIRSNAVCPCVYTCVNSVYVWCEYMCGGYMCVRCVIYVLECVACMCVLNV